MLITLGHLKAYPMTDPVHFHGELDSGSSGLDPQSKTHAAPEMIQSPFIWISD